MYAVLLAAVSVLLSCERDAGVRTPRNAAAGEVFVSASGMKMAWIPAGTFLMGSPADEPGRFDWEEATQHQVTLTSGFWMGVYPVTQALWEAVMEDNPSHFSGERRPVENVSWYDVIVFANRLSIKSGLRPAYKINGSTNPDDWGDVPRSSNQIWNEVQIVQRATGYRLPTEAQWEHATRAGTTTAFNDGTLDYRDFGEDSTIGWFNLNSGDMTRDVGQLPANAWGLHDTHGNVWEWVWDWFHAYPAEAVTNPTGASSGVFRVARGGGWFFPADALRSSRRARNVPFNQDRNLGFRLMRP